MCPRKFVWNVTAESSQKRTLQIATFLLLHFCERGSKEGQNYWALAAGASQVIPAMT